MQRAKTHEYVIKRNKCVAILLLPGWVCAMLAAAAQPSRWSW